MQVVLTCIFLLWNSSHLIPTSAEDTVAAARKSAIAGDRAQALRILRERLAENPGDTEARTLYGAVLSWDHDYSEARKQLERVLSEHPENGDAAQALANVELWSGRPDKAEALLSALVRDRPNDADVLLAHSKALAALNRNDEARQAVDRVLALDPGNRDAQRIRAGLEQTTDRWETRVEQFYEWFSDGVGNRLETQAAIKRRTAAGPVIARYSNARRFGLSSNQGEVEYYPVFRKGTYAYLNGGFSPDADLYPRYRLAADIYQPLGRGFEGTFGYRRLGFHSKVNIYTVALSLYSGPWLFTGRGYFSADLRGTGQSAQFSARRFLRNPASYWEVRYGRGSTPSEIRSAVDIGVLQSNSVAGSATAAVSKRWRVTGQFGFSHEDRIGRSGIDHYLANGGVVFLF